MSVTDTRPAPNEAMPGLRGKGVLVTGGTSGIGQAIAVRFAEYGANVAINYLARPRRPATPSSRFTRARTGCSRRESATCSFRGTSPARTTSCAMVGEAVSELGGLDVLINNAGIQISRHSHELSSDDFDKVLARQSPRARSCAPARRSGTSSPRTSRA